MNYIQVIIDGIIITGITLGAALWDGSLVYNNTEIKKEKYDITEVIAWGAAILLEIVRVYFIYRHQENSDYFFYHPYLAFSVANIVWLLVKSVKGRISAFFMVERILLWEAVILPVFSGVCLSIGWLLKLYVR